MPEIGRKVIKKIGNELQTIQPRLGMRRVNRKNFKDNVNKAMIKLFHNESQSRM